MHVSRLIRQALITLRAAVAARRGRRRPAGGRGARGGPRRRAADRRSPRAGAGRLCASDAPRQLGVRERAVVALAQVGRGVVGDRDQLGVGGGSPPPRAASSSSSAGSPAAQQRAQALALAVEGQASGQVEEQQRQARDERDRRAGEACPGPPRARARARRPRRCCGRPPGSSPRPTRRRWGRRAGRPRATRAPRRPAAWPGRRRARSR